MTLSTTYCFLFAELLVGDRDARLTVLDPDDGTVQLHPRPEPLRERVGQPLVSALQPIDLRRGGGHATQMQDGRVPEPVERRGVGASQEAQRGLRGAGLPVDLDELRIVQVVVADAERLVLVGELSEIGLDVERYQIPPRALGQIPDLALVEPEPPEHCRIVKHLLGVEAPVDSPQHVVASGVGENREIQLLRVLPKALVPRLSDVLGSTVDVQAIGEPVADGEHVPAVTPGGVQDHNLMTPLHELVATAEPGDACTGDDHLLSGARTGGPGSRSCGAIPARRVERGGRNRGGGELHRLAARETGSRLRPGWLLTLWNRTWPGHGDCPFCVRRIVDEVLCRTIVSCPRSRGCDPSSEPWSV